MFVSHLLIHELAANSPAKNNTTPSTAMGIPAADPVASTTTNSVIQAPKSKNPNRAKHAPRFDR